MFKKIELDIEAYLITIEFYLIKLLLLMRKNLWINHYSC